MTPSRISDSEITAEMTADYILERLEDLRQDVAYLMELADRITGYTLAGQVSALEAIATDIRHAERKWAQ